MSSDMAHNSEENYHTVDDEAYQPTYAEAFPPLNPSPAGEVTAPASDNHWNAKMSVRSSSITQVFRVPLEERRYKEMNENRFGEQNEQSKICQDIMARTSGVSIEMNLAKDQSLTVVITGKLDSVMKAKRMVVTQLQTQASERLHIPKEHHRFILGQKGQKLQKLELATATKISVPRSDEKSDVLTIMGTKEGIDKARHELQIISDEQAKLAFERLPIPKEYHPFICGPNNQNIENWGNQFKKARINVPPPSVQRDDITVAGEKEDVHQAVAAIREIYEEKKRKCQTVSVEVRKTQHKYVIGPRGSNLSDILKATGVSVEVPPLDSSSETITLRGEQDKLGPALTMVYAKANSVVIQEVKAPAWLHRFIIGRSGSTIRQITQDLPKVHIEFTDGEDKITIEGPPEEVGQAQRALEEITKDLLSRMNYVELNVDQKYHRFIIGKSGQNVNRIKGETGVSIRIPSDTDASNIIRIEGSPDGVAKAKQELEEMVKRMENEKTRDILIEQRFHKQIIGPQGSNIREIRDKFSQVQVTFPEPGRKSDVVQLRGPKNEVDKCYKYLQTYHQELITNNFMAEVHIFKQFHKNIIGKGGATIRKIRDETDTKIDLPSENSDSDVITITGKKANVETARNRIEAIQKELANISEVTLDIPHQFHNSIIGAKGRLISSIMQECGGVIIRFPPEKNHSDKVIIRGPKDDVEKARKQLMELANDKKESSFTVDVRANPAYHKFLIGRGGANIRKVRESTGARVIFPSSDDDDQELITIIGKKESVEKAKTELLELIKNLDNIVEAEMEVDQKHHRHFVARRGEVLHQIAMEYGGVTVSFPRSGVKSNKVTLKGAKDCVEGAKKRISDIVADLESQVTIECVITQKHHRTVMGAKGFRVQDITRTHEVGIKFPDRPTQENQASHAEGEETTVNGENGADGDRPAKTDIITITGKAENCQAAKEALLALVPITEEVPVPFEFHRFIIGQKGRDVRKMMDEFDVNISVPPADQEQDIIRVTGPPANVSAAKVALKEKCIQLQGEKEDREARSYTLEVRVDTKYHPKIIGRKGAVISKIRQDHDVNVQFPEKNAEHEDIIRIIGYESNTHTARDAILSMVKELEDMLTEDVNIDRRVHPRIIGGRGKNVRKIMDQYKVDIRFPSRESDNPDLIQITGAEDDVLDCKDYLLNLEEEYLQDISDREMMEKFMKPSSSSGSSDSRRSDQKGFVVRDAPWSATAPNTSSTDDFPAFGAAVARTPRAPVVWGPSVKR